MTSEGRSEWNDIWIALSCLGVGWLLGGLGAYFVSPGTSDPMFSLSVRREPGERARASRCVECAQPGDLLQASLRGARGAIYGVRAYLDDDLVASCDDCHSLEFTIQATGRYEIVGVQTHAGCPLASGGDLDRDLAKMNACGAHLARTSVKAR